MADTNLITPEQVKAYIPGYTDKGEDNELLDQLIASVTSIFTSYCGIDQFQSKEYTEYQDGNGTLFLFPNRTPIISVSHLYLDSDWAFESGSEFAIGVYTVIDNRYIAMREDILTEGIQNVKIVYTAGYVTVPQDIQLACIKEVGKEFQRKGEQDITNRSLNDGSVTFEKGLMKSTIEVLNRYNPGFVV